ncbi:hypothetical protein GWZ74_14460 [Vibrio cholerae]|nr:hypothetical protein [Vibrio cholerae]EJL6481731.1 hypothetical protein [Vibrio cholerae]EKF9777567.1 hypothetical protein [Vibrio cholerae]NOE84818.1 hypothetical protein [Vibrio cholerae]NOE97079.1 hypothetical protein [Vibrio cholerae]
MAFDVCLFDACA